MPLEGALRFQLDTRFLRCQLPTWYKPGIYIEMDKLTISHAPEQMNVLWRVNLKSVDWEAKGTISVCVCYCLHAAVKDSWGDRDLKLDDMFEMGRKKRSLCVVSPARVIHGFKKICLNSRLTLTAWENNLPDYHPASSRPLRKTAARRGQLASWVWMYICVYVGICICTSVCVILRGQRSSCGS